MGTKGPPWLNIQKGHSCAEDAMVKWTQHVCAFVFKIMFVND